MFERTLQSLIKGFRSHRGKDQAAYLAAVLAEIRHEVRSGDMEVKAEGLLKLIYLRMLGHVSAKAAFHVVEVMAATRYHLKFIGYLGAAQCLEPGADVLILATNLIKKDLASRYDLDAMVGLSGLCQLMTPELAQHFSPDIIAMLNHSKPAIRKKAVLALHSVLTHHPESLDAAWPRLQARLDDDDPSVVSATVSILCELARKDPRPFLPLSPQLFQLLTTSSNNWVLIKVIKLFGALSACEPRLSKRLLPSITSIISSTPAMSLLYECIHTIIVGDMFRDASGHELAQTCVEKLSQFIDDSDQNLKYIALVALLKILPSFPDLVQPHFDAIAVLLEDQDASIRLHALMLLTALARADTFERYQTLLMGALEERQDGKSRMSASDRLRAVLQAPAAAGESANDSARYAARTRRLFVREVMLCVIVTGAKQGYALQRDPASYGRVLAQVRAKADPPLQRLADRLLIDLGLDGQGSDSNGFSQDGTRHHRRVRRNIGDELDAHQTALQALHDHAEPSSSSPLKNGAPQDVEAHAARRWTRRRQARGQLRDSIFARPSLRPAAQAQRGPAPPKASKDDLADVPVVLLDLSDIGEEAAAAPTVQVKRVARGKKTRQAL